ncbi:MAG: hypothetical protein K2M68_08025 [Muribaculaceae bacterium]|nr:hypothetical protein [Muribaculaceae bacterium]
MVLKKLLYLLFGSLLTLVACGGGDNFTVIGEIEGLGTQNLHVVYRTNGKYNHLITAALDSKFTFMGASDKPVVIDIYTRTNVPVGSLVARNGETVEVKFKLNEPGYMQAKGDGISERLARFRTDNTEALNATDISSVNAAVARYVSRNPKDPASAYILTSFFDSMADPQLADSLASLLDPQAITESGMITAFTSLLSVANDTLPQFNPITLYTTGDSISTVATGGSKGIFLAIFDNDGSEPYDSVVSRLNGLQDANKKVLRVVELSVASDTAVWRNQLGAVKPVYTRCWEPGEVASPSLAQFDIRRLPWYVLADSTGTILYSGSVYRDAIRDIDNR